MPKKKKPAKKTVHLMGNAHLDPVWLWPWTEGYTEAVGLMETALKTMRDVKDFTFIRSSSQTYEWLQECEPKLFEEIKHRVMEGRWNIVGGMLEQPDMNIPSAESLIRQAFYGQRFFKQNFGVMARTGYCVDSFGHPAGLPQILKACGMDGYVFMRPLHGHRPDFSMFFDWESPDGSEVRAMHIVSYGTWSQDICPALEEAIQYRNKNCPEIIFMYGFGDHGGGPSLEIVNQLKAINAGDTEKALEYGAREKSLERVQSLMKKENVRELKFSTYNHLIDKTDRLNIKWPKVQGPLHHYGQGTYTSISAIKQHIRSLENELFTAESLWVSGRHYSISDGNCRRELDLAWKTLLFNQFHDIAAGTSFYQAVEECIRHLGYGRYLVQKATNYLMQKHYRMLDCSANTHTNFLYNPLPWPVRTVVEHMTLPIHDENGNAIPFQHIPGKAHRGGSERSTLAVVEIPGMGGVRYYGTNNKGAPEPEVRAGLLECKGPYAEEYIEIMAIPVDFDPLVAGAREALKTLNRKPPAAFDNRKRRKTCLLENEYLRAEFDKEGRLRQVYDKKRKLNILKEAVRPVLYNDGRDAWAHAWNEDMPLSFMKQEISMKSRCLGLIEDGPLRGKVATEFSYRKSTIRIEWSLTRGMKSLDAEVICNWHDRHLLAKLAIPTAMTTCKATVDTQLAPQELPLDRVEQPCQKWMDLSGAIRGKKAGLSLLNNAKYGCSFTANGMYLTLLRSAHMAHLTMEEFEPRPRSARHYMDQGVQHFKVSLVPHAGSWRQAGIQRKAMELNMPPLLLRGGTHEGPVSSFPALCEIKEKNVIPLAIKPAADHPNAVVIRLWESTGKACTVTMRIFGKTKKITFDKYEMKTIEVQERKGRIMTKEIHALEM